MNLMKVVVKFSSKFETTEKEGYSAEWCGKAICLWCDILCRVIKIFIGFYLEQKSIVCCYVNLPWREFILVLYSSILILKIFLCILHLVLFLCCNFIWYSEKTDFADDLEIFQMSTESEIYLTSVWAVGISLQG